MPSEWTLKVEWDQKRDYVTGSRCPWIMIFIRTHITSMAIDCPILYKLRFWSQFLPLLIEFIIQLVWRRISMRKRMKANVLSHSFALSHFFMSHIFRVAVRLFRYLFWQFNACWIIPHNAFATEFQALIFANKIPEGLDWVTIFPFWDRSEAREVSFYTVPLFHSMGLNIHRLWNYNAEKFVALGIRYRLEDLLL